MGNPSEFARMLSYLSNVEISLPSAISDPWEMPPIAPQTDCCEIEAEIAGLGADQRLLSHRQFSVYVGSHDQLPATVGEITRLRERTFREFQEGSGQPVDGDRFDTLYLHLFAWDHNERAIVGAYRLGRTDVLRVQAGSAGVYLGQMFEFGEEFYDGPALLEIGRSFVVPEYQRNHSSLFLLWCGIGRYLVRNPQYRSLYGVVSISRLHDSRAIAVIRDALLEPADWVHAKSPYVPDLGIEWHNYLAPRRPMLMDDVSRIVRALEDDVRDVPVLIRHYHKLGARFISAAVDQNFNNTPGLLLRLDVSSMPEKYVRTYLGEGGESYLDYGT